MRLRVHLPEKTFDWESSVALFRVGRAGSCALRFEGEAAKYASWEHAEFKVDEQGGAYVTDLGSSNGTYVDGLRIAEARPLWIGAVVQIGGKGPKLEVLELARPVPVCDVGVAPAQHQAAWFRQRGLILGLAAALLAVVGFFVLRKGAAPEGGAGQAQANLPDPDPIDKHPSQPGSGSERPASGHQGGDASPPASRDPEPKTDPAPPAQPPPTQPPPTDDPWAAAKEAGLAAYRLIAVEDPKTQTTRPFAGAVIVGPHALLTTAEVGVELARVQERGWPVKVVRDSQDAGLPVEGIRIHAGFQDAKPEEQLFFDMAILSVAERLTGAATRASAAELAAVEQGQTLVCLATSHSGDPFNRFDELRAEAYQAKVFTVTPLSAEPAAPRVLFLRGRFGDNASGSPIFDDRGRLVALYCDPAPAESGTPPERAIHYAKLIEPGLIELGLSTKENQIWVAPVVPPAEPTKKELEK